MTCFDVSDTEIKCTFRGTNQHDGTSTASFIVNGPSIRSVGADPRYTRGIEGTYDLDRITWKDGPDVKGSWTRPTSRD